MNNGEKRVNIVAVVASTARSRRTRLAVDVALANTTESGHSLNLIDLADTHVSMLDGRSLSEYNDQTAHVVELIMKANCLLLASPVYRGSYTGGFKNLLDLLPIEALEGKAIGLIAVGATPHHYLMIDTQMRSVLAWFNAYVLPGSVYLTEKDASTNEALELSGAAVKLKELMADLIDLSGRLPQKAPRPYSLARAARSNAAKKI